MDTSLFPCQTPPLIGDTGGGEGGEGDGGSSSGSLLSVGVPGAEMFTITGAHRKAITALEWSLNGMRLFSGDEEGQVSSVLL